MQFAAEYFALRYRFYLLIVSLTLVAYDLTAIVNFAITKLKGNTYFLLDDDIMISMRYARNLAAGNGLVYNVGEHVEGFSNPLSTFLAAGFHLLPISPTLIPGLLDLSNLLLSVGIVIVASRFWGTTPTNIVMGLLGSAFYVALPNHAFHAHGGYEVYMLMLALLVSIWRIEESTPLNAAILGLLPLTHGSALPLWMFLVLAMFLASKSSLASRLVLVAIALLPTIGYEIFRIIYYGDIQSNTYWLKANAGSLGGGFEYAAGWLAAVLPLIPMALYGLFRKLETKSVVTAVAICVQVTTTVALGGDIFPQYRFLFPVSLLLAVAAGRGAILFLMDVARWRDLLKRKVAFAGTFTLVLFTALVLPVMDYLLTTDALRQREDWNLQHLAEGIAIHDNTPPTAVVALFPIGYSGYFSDRRIIDMLGKTDRHIAHVAPIPGRPIGHNKTDFDYVLRLRPDYVESWLTVDQLQDIMLLREIQRDRPEGYLADLALNPTFRQVYMPNAVWDSQGSQVSFYTREPTFAQWRLEPDLGFAPSEGKQ